MNNVNMAVGYFIGMDTNDMFVRLGFCPEIIRITEISSGDRLIWSRMNGNDTCIEITATDGTVDVETAKGIKLVEFNEGKIAGDMSSDPSAVDPTEFYKANGFQITADLDTLADDKLYLYEAIGMDMPIVKITHDGGDATHTYVEDASFDLRHAGVSAGWIVYNQTNGDYAYVGEVQKPSGKDKYCRATLLTSRGGSATAAADIDDDDVIYLFPEGYAHYPLSDVGAMS